MDSNNSHQTTFQTKDGRLWSKGDLCHFAPLPANKQIWWVSAATANRLRFLSSDLWILLHIDFTFEIITILHPKHGVLEVPIPTENIVRVCPTKR